MHDYLEAGPGSGSKAAVLQVVRAGRHIGVALVQLVAFACRKDATGSPNSREDRLFNIARLSCAVVHNIIVAPAASGPAVDTVSDLTSAILKGQNLHAAAKRAAAAAAVLALPEQQARLSADSLALFRVRACAMAAKTLRLIGSLSTCRMVRRDRALAEALLTALRESRLLDHTGRLLLLLPPAAGQPVSQGLAAAQADGCFCLSATITGLEEVTNLKGIELVPQLSALLGVCGLHALLALGASTLAGADRGPCGLPRDPLLMPICETLATYPGAPFPCVRSEGMEAFMLALLADAESPAPLLPRRAHIRLLVRALQLAGASARAAAGALEWTSEGRLRVDLSWSGGRRQSSQEFARLLPPASIGHVAALAVSGLTAASAMSRPAWAAEAPTLLAPLLTGTRHCLEALTGKEEEARERLASAVATVLRNLGEPLLDGSAVRFTTAALPAPTAAALEGGVVPLLETLFRAAGDDPAGPEGYTARRLLCELKPCVSLAALLAHSPPRQAAAFLATLAKLLRRTPPAALLEPLPSKGGPLPPGAWLTLISQIMILQHSMTASSWVELPGPVDPLAPCSPFFVLSLAALQLLPVVSRLTREAAQLPPTAAPGAARSGGRDDSNRAGNLGLLDALGACQVNIILGALNRLLGAGDPAPEGRLCAALCLPFLVEEAGAVPLLGALLAALLRDGELPGVGPTAPDLLVQLAQCCVDIAALCPERVRGEPGSGGSGLPASASGAWSPAALRLLASRLRGSEPRLSEPVEALAARLEQPRPTAEGLPEVSPGAVAELAAAAERLAALRAEVRAVLPPACSNPACVSLAGDSEAGLRLQQCGRCGLASYCCRECQVAHWRAGHKEACGGGGGGSKTG